MFNYIKKHWRPEFAGVDELCSLRGRLNHIIDAYEKELARLQNSEEGSYDERRADVKLDDCSFRYNRDIYEITELFKRIVLEKFNEELP